MDEIPKELRDAGIFVIFLPPYSPDLNQIELTFSQHITQTTNNLKDVLTADINCSMHWVRSVTLFAGDPVLPMMRKQLHWLAHNVT